MFRVLFFKVFWGCGLDRIFELKIIQEWSWHYPPNPLERDKRER